MQIYSISISLMSIAFALNGIMHIFNSFPFNFFTNRFNPSLLSRASTDQMNSVTIEDLKFFVRKIVKQVVDVFFEIIV